MKKLLIILLLIIISSCASLNKNYVSVPFASNPAGAILYIDQQYVGKTPIIINVAPDKNKIATFIYKQQKKDLNMKIISSIRENRNNTLDKVRCLLDSVGMIFIVPAMSAMSIKCKDFSKKIYNVVF